MSARQELWRRLPATRHRDFRALWGGTAASSISLWTLLLGNAWVVYDLSNSSFWVGVSTFASMSPFFLAPLGGTVADRLDRRLLVRSTRLAALAVTLTLLTLALGGLLEVWMVVSLALLQGLVRSVEIPSDNALLANVVPVEDLGNAVSLSTTSQLGSRAVGPLLAGPLLDSVGVAGAYGIAALSALLAFTSVRRIRTPSRGGVTHLGQVLNNLSQGLRYIVSTPSVRALFLLVIAHCALTMSFDAMLPGFAEHQLQAVTGGFSMMLAGMGLGALLGTAVLSFTVGRRRGLVLLLTGLVSGLSPVLLAISTEVPSAVASATVMGASQAVFMAVSAILLQQVVPDDLRGRVMSFYLMSAGGVMAIANLGFASLADVVGAPSLLLIPGLTFVALLSASGLGTPSVRSILRLGAMPRSAA